jgi:hypothetical protein
MKSKLLLCAALALLVAGCKVLEPRPTPPEDPATPGGPAPTPPPVQSIPDTATLPALPPSTHIIVGLCPSTNSYTAMGVNTDTRSFTFLRTGRRATQPQAFAQFYSSGAPVTVYTGRVKLRGTAPAPSVAPTPPPPSPSPTAVPNQETQGSTGEPTYDPCTDIGDPLPEPSPKPTGSNWKPDQFTSFKNLSWYTANALNAVSDPAPAATTFPVPR